MRDATHLEQVRRQARFVRENPGEWKKSHTAFINALYDKQRAFDERLKRTPGGQEKLKKLAQLKNN